MNDQGQKRSVIFNISDIIQYVSNATVINTILNKTTGTIKAMSMDVGESLPEKLARFDTFIHVIDGKAKVIIDNVIHQFSSGQCIIVPAHSRYRIMAIERFKMTTTVIKSGYEEVIL